MGREVQRVKLNEPIVRALEAPSREEVARLYRDSILVGFACRITYTGTRAFVFSYVTKAGRERRSTIGKWPAWSVVQAREKAKELRRLVDNGGDPLQEQHETRGALTFAELVAEYQQRHVTKAGRRLRDGHKDIQTLSAAVLKWKHRPAAEISKADIRRLCEEKAEAAPSAANRLLATFSRLYNFAIRRDLLEVNPARGIERPGKETPKDRVLSESEIKTLWEGLDGVQSPAADALRVILLTAARPGEACSIEWSEVDLDTALWSLPAAKAKNGLAHRVPLTETALNIFRTQPRADRCVFPGRPKGTPLGPSQPSRLLIDHARFGIEKPFTAHDLRRTAASHMARIGIPRLVVKKILNHTERGDVTAIYERHGYDKEKREALERWERELLRIIGQAKRADVVEMPA